MSTEPSPPPGVTAGVARTGGISYLHIPATDVLQASAFYASVFGWKTGGDSNRQSFEDGTGHVAGAWVTTQEISREPGLLPYIYVEHIDETAGKIAAHGGEILQPPYPEGNLWVATFRDPAGNVMGIWQAGAR